MCNMTTYLQNNGDTKAKIAKMVSKDEVQAAKDYVVLKDKLISWDNNSTYIPDLATEFEGKILLYHYRNTYRSIPVIRTFSLVYAFGTLKFLDPDYTCYNMFIGRCVNKFIYMIIEFGKKGLLLWRMIIVKTWLIAWSKTQAVAVVLHTMPMT